MLHVAFGAAEVAARLARAVGPAGVVCLGCPLALGGWNAGERELITLSRPPLVQLHIEPKRLLLVVAPYVPLFALNACAAAAVPEVWLYEGREGLLTALSNPIEGSYRRRSLILPGERRRLTALPAVEFSPLPTR